MLNGFAFAPSFNKKSVSDSLEAIATTLVGCTGGSRRQGTVPSADTHQRAPSDSDEKSGWRAAHVSPGNHPATGLQRQAKITFRRDGDHVAQRCRHRSLPVGIIAVCHNCAIAPQKKVVKYTGGNGHNIAQGFEALELAGIVIPPSKNRALALEHEAMPAPPDIATTCDNPVGTVACPARMPLKS